MIDDTFVLRSHAENFVTRNVGKSLRDKLLSFETTVPTETRITLDATGVTLITPSFADEFFGRTASVFGLDRFRTRFRIIGIEADVKILINNVVRNRLMLDRRKSESPRSTTDDDGQEHLKDA